MTLNLEVSIYWLFQLGRIEQTRNERKSVLPSEALSVKALLHLRDIMSKLARKKLINPVFPGFLGARQQQQTAGISPGVFI
jgi:hypothetical protein